MNQDSMKTSNRSNILKMEIRISRATYDEQGLHNIRHRILHNLLKLGFNIS